MNSTDYDIVTRLLTITLVFAGLAGCGRPPSTETGPPDSDAAYAGAQPHLARASDGTVVLSWLQPGNETVSLRFVTRDDEAWSAPRTVATGAGWFVNWADFPSVSPIRGDLWAAHWLVKRPGGIYAYDVAVALSSDAGDSWGAPITPHTDGTRTEHGFVSLYRWQDQVGALWLDGRHMTGEHGAGHGGGMTLRSARIGADGDIVSGELVDDLVCDCCQTDIAITADGPIAVYRNRTPGEIRDIYVARYVADDGWQTGIPVADDGWEISGCPVNGPAIVADGRDVAVAWFTAADGVPRVRAARSSDGGISFSDAVDVDVDTPVGRVDIETTSNGTILVSYLAKSDDGGGEIVVQAIDDNGEPGARRVVAQTETSRSAGFPQMVRQGEELVFAWTDTSVEPDQVRTATLDATQFN